MFVNPTYDSSSFFSSPRRLASGDTPREGTEEHVSRPVVNHQRPDVEHRAQHQTTEEKAKSVFAMHPVEETELQRQQGLQVTMRAALSESLQGVIDGHSLKETAGGSSDAQGNPKKNLCTQQTVSEQYSSLPIRAVRPDNTDASDHNCNQSSQNGDYPGPSPLLERFLSAADPAMGHKSRLSESSAQLPEDSLTPTTQPVLSPTPAGKGLRAAVPVSTQTATDTDETPRTWALPTHEHVASLSQSISFAHDPRTRATASASNGSSPGVTQLPRNPAAQTVLYPTTLQSTSAHNTMSALDSMSSPSQLLVPIEAVNHLTSLSKDPEGTSGPTQAPAHPPSRPPLSPNKQLHTVMQQRALRSPAQSPSKPPGSSNHPNRGYAVPVLPMPIPGHDLSSGLPTAPSPGWTLAPSEWTVDDRAGGGSFMEGLSGVISRSSSTKVSSVCASNPNSSPAALPLRLRYGATPSPEWEAMSGEPSMEEVSPMTYLSTGSSKSMLSPAVHGAAPATGASLQSTPGKAAVKPSLGQDASTQVSPWQGGRQTEGVSGPLRKRFGGIFDNTNNPRASYMSAVTADTIVTATDSAGTAVTPASGGSGGTSPQISPLSEAVLREHSASTGLQVVHEPASPHATGPTSALTSPNNSITSSHDGDFYPPSRPHSPVALPDRPAPIDPTTVLPSALVADPFPADAFAGALRMCAVSSSPLDDNMLPGGALALGQCVPASRTNSAIPSATSKATSPEGSGENGNGVVPCQPTVSPSPTPVAAAAEAAAAATGSPTPTPPLNRSPAKPASRVSRVIPGSATKAARDMLGLNRASPVAWAAGGAAQRRGLGTPPTRGSGPISQESQDPKLAASGGRRRAHTEVRGIPMPCRAGSKSPGPSVNLQRANMRLQESLNISTSSPAESTGEAAGESPASVPHTPAPTPTTPLPPPGVKRWAAKSAAPAIPSPLGAARSPPAAGRKPAVPLHNTNTSPLAVAKRNAKSSATKASPGTRTAASKLRQRTSSSAKEPSSATQNHSKAGASATSPHTVSDAEVAVDSYAATLSSAVSPGLCASPYVDVRASYCNTAAASSMHEDSMNHDQEQVPANMQDGSPRAQSKKVLEGLGSVHEQHATDEQCATPVQTSSVSKVVSEPATCASTIDLVPVTDARACASCITDAEMHAESSMATPFGVSAMRKYPTPQKTQSASPPDNEQEGAPEASPVLPLLGPAVTPVSSVASAVVHDAHTYKHSPNSSAAASATGGPQAAQNATAFAQAQSEPHEGTMAAKQAAGHLVEPPTLPRGDHSTRHAAESATEAAAPVALPIVVTDLHACVVDACNVVAAEGHGTSKAEQLADDGNLDASAAIAVQEMSGDRDYGSPAPDGDQNWDVCEGNNLAGRHLSHFAVSTTHCETHLQVDTTDEYAAQHACHALQSPAISAGSTSAPTQRPQHHEGAPVTLQGAIDRGTFVSDQLQTQSVYCEASAAAGGPGTPRHNHMKSLGSEALHRLEGEESAASAPTPVSLGQQRGEGMGDMDSAADVAELPCTVDALASGCSAVEVQITNMVGDSAHSSVAVQHLEVPVDTSYAHACNEQPEGKSNSGHGRLQVEVPAVEALMGGQAKAAAMVSPAAVELQDGPSQNCHAVAEHVHGGVLATACAADSGGNYGESENLDDYSGNGSTTQQASVRAASIRDADVAPSDSGKAGSGSNLPPGSSQRVQAVVTGAVAMHGEAQTWHAAEEHLRTLEGPDEGAPEANGAMVRVGSTCGSQEAAVGLEVRLEAAPGACQHGHEEGPDALFDSCELHEATLEQDSCSQGRSKGFGPGGLSLQIVDLSENPISVKMQAPEELGAVGGSPRLSPRRLSHGHACRHFFVPSTTSIDDMSLTSTADLDAMSTLEAATHGAAAAAADAENEHSTKGAAQSKGMGVGALAVPPLLAMHALGHASMNNSPEPPSARTLVSPSMPLLPPGSARVSPPPVVPEEQSPQKLAEASLMHAVEASGSYVAPGSMHDKHTCVEEPGDEAAVDLSLHAFNQQWRSEFGNGACTDEASTGDLTGFLGGGKSGRQEALDAPPTPMMGMHAHATPPASPGGSMSRTPSGMLSPGGMSMHIRSRSGLLSTAGGVEAAEAIAIEAAAAAAHFVPPKLSGDASFSREYEDTWNEAMEGLGDALHEAADAAAARAERKRIKQERKQRRLSGFGGYSGTLGPSGSFLEGKGAQYISGGVSPCQRRLSLGSAHDSGPYHGSAQAKTPQGMHTPPSMAPGGVVLSTLSTPSSESQGWGGLSGGGMACSGAPVSTAASDVASHVGACMSAPIAGGECSYDALSERGLQSAVTGDFGGNFAVSTGALTREASGMSLGGSVRLAGSHGAGKMKRMKKSIKASFKKLFTRKKGSVTECSSQAASGM